MADRFAFRPTSLGRPLVFVFLFRKGGVAHHRCKRGGRAGGHAAPLYAISIPIQNIEDLPSCPCTEGSNGTPRHTLLVSQGAQCVDRNRPSDTVSVPCDLPTPLKKGRGQEAEGAPEAHHPKPEPSHIFLSCDPMPNRAIKAPERRRPEKGEAQIGNPPRWRYTSRSRVALGRLPLRLPCNEPPNSQDTATRGQCWSREVGPIEIH